MPVSSTTENTEDPGPPRAPGERMEIETLEDLSRKMNRTDDLAEGAVLPDQDEPAAPAPTVVREFMNSFAIGLWLSLRAFPAVRTC